MFESVDHETAKITKNGVTISLTIKDLTSAVDFIRNQKKSDFITLYTDASHNQKTKQATLGYKGRCCFGKIEKSIPMENISDNNLAELLAIEAAIKDSVELYPNLEGFFINTDSKTSQSVMMGQIEGHPDMKAVRDRIMLLVGKRWIRTKWVKAHTNRTDIRSHMNREADSLTRIRVKS